MAAMSTDAHLHRPTIFGGRPVVFCKSTTSLHLTLSSFDDPASGIDFQSIELLGPGSQCIEPTSSATIIPSSATANATGSDFVFDFAPGSGSDFASGSFASGSEWDFASDFASGPGSDNAAAVNPDEIIDLTTGVAHWEPLGYLTTAPPSWYQPTHGSWLGQSNWNPLLSSSHQVESKKAV